MCISRELRGRQGQDHGSPCGPWKRDGFYSKCSRKGFLQRVAVSVFLSVKNHSASSIENGLEKGKTGSRRLLQSFRQEKGGTGRTRTTIMPMERRRIWHLLWGYTY